jgi:hypothetical protein
MGGEGAASQGGKVRWPRNGRKEVMPQMASDAASNSPQPFFPHPLTEDQLLGQHFFGILHRARAEIVELRAELAERRHQEGGSPAPIGTQHPYRSPPRGHHTYGSPAYRTRIDLDP